MSACSGCAWWRARANKPGWGDCERASCYAGKPFVEGTTAYAEDWGEQSAQLVTRDDFGCNAVVYAEKKRRC